MNAAAKGLPAPDGGDELVAAMRRRRRRDEERQEEQGLLPDLPPDVVTPRDHDVVTSRAHDVTNSGSSLLTSPNGASTRRGQRRRTTAPVAADAVAWTVRFEPGEALDIDEWVVSLRRELERAKVDKAEIVRSLLWLARSRPAVRRALLSELKRPTRPLAGPGQAPRQEPAGGPS